MDIWTQESGKIFFSKGFYFSKIEMCEKNEISNIQFKIQVK